jgi:excisionase family DNA binding protein
MMKLLTLDEVAEQLSVSRSTVSRLVRNGELRSAQLGGNRRIAESDLQDYIANVFAVT